MKLRKEILNLINILLINSGQLSDPNLIKKMESFGAAT